MRRRVYLQVGGFSPVVFFFGEETVLAQDLMAAGWGLAYVEGVVAHHHPQPGAGRSGRDRLQQRNRLLSSWLRRPLRTALADTAALAARPRDPAARGALLDAARRLLGALADRRPLPVHVEEQVRLLEAAGD